MADEELPSYGEALVLSTAVGELDNSKFVEGVTRSDSVSEVDTTKNGDCYSIFFESTPMAMDIYPHTMESITIRDFILQVSNKIRLPVSDFRVTIEGDEGIDTYNIDKVSSLGVKDFLIVKNSNIGASGGLNSRSLLARNKSFTQSRSSWVTTSSKHKMLKVFICVITLATLGLGLAMFIPKIKEYNDQAKVCKPFNMTDCDSYYSLHENHTNVDCAWGTYKVGKYSYVTECRPSWSKWFNAIIVGMTFFIIAISMKIVFVLLIEIESHWKFTGPYDFVANMFGLIYGVLFYQRDWTPNISLAFFIVCILQIVYLFAHLFYSFS